MNRENKNQASLSFCGELGLSYSYFDQRLLPSLPVIREMCAGKPTRRKHCDEIEVLMVHSGTGSILVNGTSYPLSEGSSGILYSWQLYEIRPDPGVILRYTSIRISYSTFMFILSVPSCSILPILPEHKFLTRFEGEELVRCTRLVETMTPAGTGTKLYEKTRIMAPLEELLARILWNLKEGSASHPARKYAESCAADLRGSASV